MNRKWECLALIVFLFTMPQFVFGQMDGTETVADVKVYKGAFYVHGQSDTYYPVIFKRGDQDKINHLKIYRRFNEPGPNDLSPTHRGALALEIDTNYGNWGGAVYDWRVMDLRQRYHSTFADATHGMHNMGFIVWLRGGGFRYKYESEKATNIQVAYDSNTLIYSCPFDASKSVYAPAPKTNINWDRVNAHKNDHWDHIKGKNINWQKSNQNIYFNTGNIGVGTDNPGDYKLAVDGKIGAREIEVTTTSWADYVFEEDYKLKSLAETENYIKENKHLPGIPSEAEVKQNGVNIGEIQAKLLAKIEELTLHLIEQNKEIKNLKKAYTQMKQKNDQLSNQLVSLKSGQNFQRLSNP